MTREQTIIMVLDEESGYDDFLAFVRQRGWRSYRAEQGDGSTRPFEDVWANDDQTQAIHYVDDPRMGTRFLWLRGANQFELASALLGWVTAYEPDELIDAARTAESLDDVVDGLFRLAVQFDEHHPDAFEIFERFSGSPHAAIRKAVVQALTYASWPEGVPLLEKLADDQDADVKEFARKNLDDLRRRLARQSQGPG